MLQYIKDDHDLHKDMAVECYKLPPEQVSKPIRGVVKGGFVFASFYGDWYHQICQNLWFAMDREDLRLENGIKLKDHLAAQGVTRIGDLNPKDGTAPGTFEDHIKKVHEKFWNVRFPVYTAWKEQWWSDYKTNGFYQMLTGFISRGVFSKNEAINGGIQGSAFHCCLWSLIRLNEMLQKYKMKSMVVGQIHDSILIDVHKDEFDLVVQSAQDIMTNRISEAWKWLIVPLGVEAEVGKKNWFEKEKVKLAV